MSRGWLAAGAVGVAAVAVSVAVGVWFFVRRDVAEPASVKDAIVAFREQEAAGAVRQSPIPTGVYVYATDGFERTDALGGVTHRYPATSSITVTADPCGVRLRWDVLRGRYTTWTACVRPEGWLQRTRDERHTFFGIADETIYRCTDTPFRPAGDTPGTAFTVSCTTGSATEHGRGRVVGREKLGVGDAEVECAHVRTVTTFGGATTGSATFDFWLARDTGLPVRVTMVSRTTNGSLIGDVHYDEDVSLELTSLTPRR
jgi:hypothetical protein